jgi:cephalosporin hydroxylase
MEDKKHNEFFPMRFLDQKRGLQDMIGYLNTFFETSDKPMIEIGAYIGDSTMMFAEDFGFVVTIDPFIDNYPENYGVSQYAEFSKVYAQFIKNTEQILNIGLIKETSDEAFKKFHNMKVWFVYIDGCHTYEQVYKDIMNYKPFIVKGGFIGGHDYVPGWAGVMKAVDELLGPPDQVFCDGSWVKRILI